MPDISLWTMEKLYGQQMKRAASAYLRSLEQAPIIASRPAPSPGVWVGGPRLCRRTTTARLPTRQSPTSERSQVRTPRARRGEAGPVGGGDPPDGRSRLESAADERWGSVTGSAVRPAGLLARSGYAVGQPWGGSGGGALRKGLRYARGACPPLVAWESISAP